MDLFPFRECIAMARYHPIDAPPPTPEFEEDRCHVRFELSFFKSLNDRFDAPPQIIPLRRFFSEGAEIARRAVVSSGWAEGPWTDDFVECFADMLFEQELMVTADPRSSSEAGMILSYTLVLFVGMFPWRFLEWRESVHAVRESEETAATAVRTFAAEEGALRGLKEVAIDRREDEEEGEGESCIICMDKLSINGGKCLEMPCSHLFHQPCLLHWLQLNHVCPLCRHALPIHNKYFT